MTNRWWVTFCNLIKADSSRLFLSWPTVCEQHCTFYKRKSYHICCWPTGCEWHLMHILWKAVSSHLSLWPTVCECHCPFCESSLITSCPMTNRMWVTLHILWKAHLFLWPTASKWYCKFCERHSHHTFNFLWQTASESQHWTFCVTSFPMANRMWVTLPYCEKSLVTPSIPYGQQVVSDIFHFSKGSLIAYD